MILPQLQWLINQSIVENELMISSARSDFQFGTSIIYEIELIDNISCEILQGEKKWEYQCVKEWCEWSYLLLILHYNYKTTAECVRWRDYKRKIS